MRFASGLKFQFTFLIKRVDFSKVYCSFCRLFFCKHLLGEKAVMAKIIDNEQGRRIIKMSVDDVISVVREYQRIVKNHKTYDVIRENLSQTCIYLPEEV